MLSGLNIDQINDALHHLARSGLCAAQSAKIGEAASSCRLKRQLAPVIEVLSCWGAALVG